MRNLFKLKVTDVVGRSPWDEKTRLLNRGDFLITHPDYLTVGRGASVGDGVVATTPEVPGIKDTAILIGRHATVGRRTVLSVGAGQRMAIHDHAVVEQSGFLEGDLSIGRYGIVSPNCCLSSVDHWSQRNHPAWLIKDQTAHEASLPIVIDEDVWLGWGVVVKPGVHIGRGAVIGANSVVTKEVPPFSIQSGSPAREVSARLKFEPPRKLDATNEAHWAYFYSGFLLQQREVQVSKRHASLFAKHWCRVVVGAGKIKKIAVLGHLSPSVHSVELRVFINRVAVGTISVKTPSFNESITVDTSASSAESRKNLPPILRDYNEIELKVVPERPEDSEREADYGIVAINVG